MMEKDTNKYDRTFFDLNREEERKKNRAADRFIYPA
jgi:hypothetical protein